MLFADSSALPPARFCGAVKAWLATAPGPVDKPLGAVGALVDDLLQQLAWSADAATFERQLMRLASHEVSKDAGMPAPRYNADAAEVALGLWHLARA